MNSEREREKKQYFLSLSLKNVDEFKFENNVFILLNYLFKNKQKRLTTFGVKYSMYYKIKRKTKHAILTTTMYIYFLLLPLLNGCFNN